MRTEKTDIVIVGCGVAGLYCALNLSEDKKIIVVTKDIAPFWLRAESVSCGTIRTMTPFTKTP